MALIGILQKMPIKNLRGTVTSDFKKLDSFTLETSKNHLIRNFLRNRRVRVKYIKINIPYSESPIPVSQKIAIFIHMIGISVVQILAV